jgi:TctA family transporter
MYNFYNYDLVLVLINLNYLLDPLTLNFYNFLTVPLIPAILTLTCSYRHVESFNTICLVFKAMFGVLFYLLLVFGCYCLDATIYGNLQDLEEQDFEQQLAGKQGKCSLIMLNLYSFSL